MKTKQISLLIALGCIGAGAATNYDLLGRKGSQMNSPMVYKNFNYSAKKSSLESQALAKQGLSGTALAIEGIHDPTMVDGLPRHGGGYEEADRYFIYKSSGVDRYWIGDEISSYTYAKRMNSYFTPIYRNRTQSQGSRSYKTVKKTNTEYTISFSSQASSHQDASPYVKNQTLTYRSSSDLRKISLFDNVDIRYTDNTSEEIGVYIAADAEPTQMKSGDASKYIPLASCSQTAMPGHENEASQMLYALKTFSTTAVPFVINVSCGVDFPTNPENEYPQILVGLHARKDVNGNSGATNAYGNRAKELDNYIYNNHVVEVVGAGNFGAKPADGSDWNGYLTSEAHAANAITVGAVNYNGNIEKTTSWKNPAYGGQKPEIYNYTNYYLGSLSKKTFTKGSTNYTYNPFINGTRGAAANTAAAIADLLREEPFLRWHPEIVKARVLTASDKFTSGNVVDKDNGSGVILNHSKLFDESDRFKNGVTINKNINGTYTNYSRFWNGDLSKMATTVNGKKVIKFTTKVYKNHTYRAAISWLSSGNDIANIGKIPQDFDLAAYWNDNAQQDDEKTVNGTLKEYDYFTTDYENTRATFITQSTSGSNPYELIEFDASKTSYVTFVITLYSENSNSENKGKVQLGFNLLDIDEW